MLLFFKILVLGLGTGMSFGGAVQDFLVKSQTNSTVFLSLYILVGILLFD